MKYLIENIQGVAHFLSRIKRSSVNVLLSHFVILFGLIPALNFLTHRILSFGGINYLSSDNILALARTHSFVFIGLFLLLALIVLLAFFEYSFLLLSVYYIYLDIPLTLAQLLKMSFFQLKKLRPTSFLFFLPYFIILLPIIGFNYRSNLLSKIKIPAFVMDYIFTNRVTIIALAVIVYLILLYFSLSLSFVLPRMILTKARLRDAIRYSWQITRRRLWYFIGKFIIFAGCLFLLIAGATAALLFLQQTIEHYWNAAALASAVVIMALLQLLFIINLIGSTTLIFFIGIDFLARHAELPQLKVPHFSTDQKFSWLTSRKTLTILLVLFLGGLFTYNHHFLTAEDARRPYVISHRGVSHGNGVQNSIPALIKTAQLHPDYVEIDIQQTKDKQFVVMHDPDLKTLTGVDRRPQELTLSELTKLTQHENGYTAPVVSFDEYLKAAKNLQQKLLIEIKTSTLDAPGLVNDFLQKYQGEIESQHYELQSLDYQLVEKIKKKAPALVVGYIMPFNIVGPPVSSADFLTMEYSTINGDFIDAARNDHKKVYVWTVNSADAVSRMRFYGTDAIITDEVALTHKTLERDSKMRYHYADKLLYFTIGIG